MCHLAAAWVLYLWVFLLCNIYVTDFPHKDLQCVTNFSSDRNYSQVTVQVVTQLIFSSGFLAFNREIMTGKRILTPTLS